MTQQHRFGGPWTVKKLEVLRKYLSAYTQVMKNTQFRTAYIDAFAGTGRIDAKRDPVSEHQRSFFEGDETDGTAFLDGSARVALKIEPPFDRYIFVERSQARCDELAQLKAEFHALADSIVIECGEANHVIRTLCNRSWFGDRAVLFLDPYGMQVEWSTVEAISNTGAIDMWLLFPLGMGANRLITNDGEMPASWEARLTSFFGTEEWKDRFYARYPEKGLFGSREVRQKRVTEEGIKGYVSQRLDKLFPGVSSSVGRLKNSTGSTLYLLFFAAANPNGAAIARRIADSLLRKLS